MNRFLFLFVTTLLGACANPQAGPSEGERLIIDRILQIRELRNTIGEDCWPDLAASEYDAPLLYYTDSICYAANPTPQFREEFGARLLWSAQGVDIYKTIRPDSLPFHMETHLTFDDSTRYDGKMPFLHCSSPELTAATISDVTTDAAWLPMVLHEYTHGVQFRYGDFTRAFARLAASVPENSFINLYRTHAWLREAVDSENSSLLAALASDRRTAQDSCIRSFLTQRTARKQQMAQQFGDSIVHAEGIYEMMEGAARYVEAKAGFRLGSYTDHDEWLYRTDKSPYLFATGYNLMRLFDKFDIDKSGLFKEHTFSLEEYLTNYIQP